MMQRSLFYSTPIITFDQPLWWKAYLLIEEEPEQSELKSMVLRLGGFHTQMSFLGALGHLMAGSGIEETIQTVYTSVEHILSGKAISRAVHAHLLTDHALNEILLTNMISSDQPNEDSLENSIHKNFVPHLEKLYTDITSDKISLEECLNDRLLQEFN